MASERPACTHIQTVEDVKQRAFTISLDFLDHQFVIDTSMARDVCSSSRHDPWRSSNRELTYTLDAMSLAVRIWSVRASRDFHRQVQPRALLL
jgi:hypothetical protein